MKLSKSMVSVIAIGAVLVSAYALGLVIRQTRTGTRSAVPAARETTDETARQSGPDGRSAKDTPAERARVKEKKAQVLERMGELTKEEQEQFKDKLIQQMGGRRGGKPSGALTPEERRVRRIKTQDPIPAGGPTQDANTPAAPPQSTDPQQSAEKVGGTP
jgi:hypothetical protein